MAGTRKRQTLMAAAALCAAAWWVGAAPASAVEWKTGVELRQQLDAQVGLQWGGASLREALANLSATYAVAIFLDRRVDPDQVISFTAQGLPLREAIERLARQLDLGVSYVGPVVYLGPRPLVDKLATLAAVKEQEIRSMPAGDARRLASLKAWSWPMLSTPKDLVAELAAAEKVQIHGAEKVPHDLWPAVELPPLSFADRLTLVLAGFDATFEVLPNQPQVRLAAIPKQVLLEKDYRAPGNTTDWPAELGRRYPRARITQEGRRISVSASWEEHEEIARLIRGEKVTRRATVDAGGQLAYTLTIENQPLGAVARQLAASLKLEIQFDPRIDEQALARLISAKVEDASRDQLLQAVFAPAGLTYRIDGQTLRVSPPESTD